MLMSAKSEIEDIQHEHQREIEGLLDGVRELTHEVQMQTLICNNFIPQEYFELISQQAHWNEDIGEWQLVSHLVFIVAICHWRTLSQ